MYLTLDFSKELESITCKSLVQAIPDCHNIHADPMTDKMTFHSPLHKQNTGEIKRQTK